jgi:predicted ATPase
MFDYIKIEGFRSFKNVELHLSPLSVLIGPNNGGKSNFLDLMSFMSEAGQGHLADGIAVRGGFRSVAYGFTWLDEIRLEFRFRREQNALGLLGLGGVSLLPGELQSDIRFKLGLKFDGIVPTIALEAITEEPSSERPHPTPVMRRSEGRCVFRAVDQETGLRTEETFPVGTERENRKTGAPSILNAIRRAKALESQSELAIFQVKDLYRYPIPYALLKQFQEWTQYHGINVGSGAPVRLPSLLRPSTRLSEDGSNLSAILHTIKENHREVWDDVLELLHTANPEFQDIRIPGEGGDGRVFFRWFERPFEKDGISANLLSDGTLKLLCLIAILKNPDPPPLICIDEPELGLHPDWIELVAELLQDAAMRTQVIVATHSPQIVAKMEPEQVIVAEKENGETTLERLSAKDLEKWLKDFNLAELWLSGHFGGRP